ncbi:MAG: pilus assembly protein [Burkholderiaceae bacterium]|nr:pilus assembly protein [Burkholderiaceae bacterium]
MIPFLYPAQMRTSRVRRRRRSLARGVATIELALVLPVLLILALGVIDFSRAIQFNNVLVHLSREGANLSARTTETPDYILAALMDNATPLDMDGVGMMYITKLVGRSDGSARVDAQYRHSSKGNRALASRIYACPSWSGSGACNVPSNQTLRLAVNLLDGETVYAVEAMYDYTPFTRYVMSDDPRLYALTIL